MSGIHVLFFFYRNQHSKCIKYWNEIENVFGGKCIAANVVCQCTNKYACLYNTNENTWAKKKKKWWNVVYDLGQIDSSIHVNDWKCFSIYAHCRHIQRDFTFYVRQTCTFCSFWCCFYSIRFRCCQRFRGCGVLLLLFRSHQIDTICFWVPIWN